MRALSLLVILGMTASTALGADLYSQLKKELPEGTYHGKRHDGKPCQLVVIEISDAQYRSLYKVTSFFPDSEKKQTFEVRRTGEVFRDIYWDSSTDKSYGGFVGSTKLDPRKGNDRTVVQVARGKKLKSSQTYWEGYEKELLLGISEIPKQRGFKGPAWRVFVGAMNAGKIGFGGQTCHIEPLK